MPSPFQLHDRLAKERYEEEYLRPWAMRSRLSRGRAHPEDEDPLRTVWERDRDRVVHSTAFRRLMYKTQVFVYREGDHNRTRLSHSLEVAQVARSVGSALGLNEPFCEALALCHDIGHPPFGHRGEWALDDLMREHGGFRHNAQVLRVVDQLERRSPAYAGLNLTFEVRVSLLKHESDADWPAEFQPRPVQPYLEAQVVDLADSTAYDVHDVEDGLRARIFEEHTLCDEVGLWRHAREAVERRHPGFLSGSSDEALRIKTVTNALIKICINDLIQASAARIEAAGLTNPEDARERPDALVGHSPELAPAVTEWQSFLQRRFYRHPRLTELTEHAVRILGPLFAVYMRAPEEMPIWYQGWVERVGLARAVCDYLAGMTDRFAEREFARLVGADR